MSKSDSMDDENLGGGGGGGSSKLFIPMLLLAVINVAGTGFVAFKAMKPVKVQVEQVPAAGPHDGVGPVATLEPFVVNLNEPSGTRFLKASFEVELTSPHAMEELEKVKRVV